MEITASNKSLNVVALNSPSKTYTRPAERSHRLALHIASKSPSKYILPLSVNVSPYPRCFISLATADSTPKVAVAKRRNLSIPSPFVG
jgi:hypothetical protein